MGEDGTCPCECECEDGSMQQLDSAGHCPCECECMNCQQSTIGPEGCICPEDTCPECEPGTAPRWVDCECTCDEEECGFPPSCAEGRKGPNCEEPHCPACPSCSGNGACTKSGECASSCSCAPRWTGLNASTIQFTYFLYIQNARYKYISYICTLSTGECCEIPDPPPAFGDPHLETMDGVSFDYFGIGQFWFCLSEANDFGIQARFFYFGQTSFTGAVAVKIASSVLTLTTPPGGPVLRCVA